MEEYGLVEEALQRALNDLYDPLSLRKSPLLAMLHLQQEPEPARALRELLLSAIEALKPEPGTPSVCHRYYQALHFRYVQGLTTVDVANQLGLSPRHLRRIHRDAIARLADYLSNHYKVEPGPSSPTLPEDVSPQNAQATATVDSELAWLHESLVNRIAPLSDGIAETLCLMATIVQERGVRLQWVDPVPDVAVSVPRTVLRQIVLSLVTMVVQAISGDSAALQEDAPQGEVQIRAYAQGTGAVIEVQARWPAAAPGPRLQDNMEQADMGRRLTELYRGQISITSGAEELVASVWLPLAQQIKVLVIEDNADTVQLWQRYVQQTGFRLIAEKDPQCALERAAELEPDIIILDVMMPGVDGWDLLAQFRHHPATSNTPLIVCTVLPQEELALALGASDFIRKPLTRKGLLDALERQIGGVEPGSERAGPA